MIGSWLFSQRECQKVKQSLRVEMLKCLLVVQSRLHCRVSTAVVSTPPIFVALYALSNWPVFFYGQAEVLALKDAARLQAVLKMYDDKARRRDILPALLCDSDGFSGQLFGSSDLYRESRPEACC